MTMNTKVPSVTETMFNVLFIHTYQINGQTEFDDKYHNHT